MKRLLFIALNSFLLLSQAPLNADPDGRFDGRIGGRDRFDGDRGSGGCGDWNRGRGRNDDNCGRGSVYTGQAGSTSLYDTLFSLSITTTGVSVGADAASRHNKEEIGLVAKDIVIYERSGAMSDRLKNILDRYKKYEGTTQSDSENIADIKKIMSAAHHIDSDDDTSSESYENLELADLASAGSSDEE
jgi:hypothetical protein